MQDTPQSGQSRLRDRLAGLASVFRRPGIRSLAGFVVLAGVFLGSYLYFQGWPGLNEPKPVALENRDTAEEAGPGQEAAPSTAPTSSARPGSSAGRRRPRASGAPPSRTSW